MSLWVIHYNRRICQPQICQLLVSTITATAAPTINSINATMMPTNIPTDIPLQNGFALAFIMHNLLSFNGKIVLSYTSRRGVYNYQMVIKVLSQVTNDTYYTQRMYEIQQEVIGFCCCQQPKINQCSK